MTKTPLHELRAGESAILSEIAETLPLRQRLLDLGWSSGTPIQIVRKSLFGDPIQFQVRESQFAIRKYDAAQIQVFRN